MRTLRQVITSSLAITALATSVLLTACNPVSSTSFQEHSAVADCYSLLDSVVQRHRTGDTAGDINSEMDMLSRSCSTEYDIATDYFSTATSAGSFGPESCDLWSEYNISPEAIELLREDGLCTSGGVAVQPDPSWPEGGLGWNEAEAYAGSYQRVCGPLTSVRETYDGVFVNIGTDYPSPDRFTFIIWGDWYLDPIDADAVICAAGTIYLYEGVAQAELAEPGELEIWR